MTDRIIYVHPDHTSDSVTIITPKAFDALLEEGWEIKETKTEKISGKKVTVHHLYKPSKERGLSVTGGDRPQRDEMGLAIRPERGGESTRSLALSNNRSFLGGSDFEGIPGIQVATSKLIETAFSMGTDAANQQQPESACPWPSGIGRTQWLRGYHAAVKAGAAGADPALLKDAYEAGKLAAKGDENLEVHCPYPANTGHYHEWLRGFKEAGGRVEA